MNTTAPTGDQAAELSAVLGRFVSDVMCYDTADTLRVLQREDLSMPRIVALGFLDRRESASISEISAYLHLSLANTSMLVDKLVCHGFVTRAEDASDRRHKLVRLTEKGQAIVEELRATRLNSVVRRMLLLPSDLLARTVEVLRDVTRLLPQIPMEPSPERPIGYAPEIEIDQVQR